jgi:molybdenum cofactor biosynthesis enzyme MoaA
LWKESDAVIRKNCYVFLMNKQDLSTFCANPWVHFHLQNWGEVYPCCVAKDPVSKVSSKNKLDLSNCFNSDAYKKLRLQMLSGEKPKTCEFCFKSEQNGIKSIRQGVNEKYQQEISSMLNNTRQDGSISSNILSADIRIGNLCNLKCRMCNPIFSKHLEDEWKELQLPQGLVLDNSSDEDETWVRFFSENPKLHHIRLAGGEPLITPRVIWILNYLVKIDRAKDMSIDFHTNLSVLPDSFKKLFRQFQLVTIRVSLEGFDKVNSYIRYPSNWQKMSENLRKLNEWAEQRHLNASIATTVQAYNILNLDELLEYSLELKNFQLPFLNILQDPIEFRPQVLPISYRETAERKLQAFLPKLHVSNFPEEEKTRLANAIRGIINDIYSFDSVEHLGKFIDRSRAHDRYRKQNILDFVPELSPMFLTN